MVHYAYAAYQSTNDGNQGEHFNWILVTPDRNTADTYFRALQQVKSVTTSDNNGNPSSKLDFPTVDRVGAQFWSYDTSDGENFHNAARALCGNPKMKEVNPAFRAVFGKIRVYWVGPYSGQNFKTFFPQDDGGSILSDTLSGDSFFVKRRGFDNYWYLSGAGNVIIDSFRRSRFIFTIVTKKDEQRYPKMPIIDTDEVKIEVLESGNKRPVGINNDNQLVAGSGLKRNKFTFGDLRTRFSIQPGSLIHPNASKEDVSLLTWADTDSLGSTDSFEIKEGVEVNEE